MERNVKMVKGENIARIYTWNTDFYNKKFASYISENKIKEKVFDESHVIYDLKEGIIFKISNEPETILFVNGKKSLISKMDELEDESN